MAIKPALYGKNGKLHTGFDHKRFAAVMKKCLHRWLITYDNTTRHYLSRNNISARNVISKIK
ncbi:MAG: hypothetical protein JJT94_14510 [Bernardetiaceae bacterium]|nr:hypothetical protein [Bernardetiaceae bacterium]